MAIVVGILGAHYLSNWKEQRVEIEIEMEYLGNLLVDVGTINNSSRLRSSFLIFVYSSPAITLI